MRRLLGAAALSLPLLLATPSFAQPHGGAQQLGTAAPSLTPNLTPRTSGRPALFAMSTRSTERQLGRGRVLLFGGWQPTERMMLGIGLFRIPKSATANPNELRTNPMKDPTGRTSRLAAVGLSLAF